jgi:hypothetical protein
MGRGLLKAQLRDFDRIGEQVEASVEEKRREGYDRKYEYSDAIKSGYGVFFFQHPSMLNFQQEMQQKNKRSNAENILDVQEIPSNNQITRLLDGIKPEHMAGTFNNNLKLADKYGGLEHYRVLDGGCLGALDGTWRFASKEIHCDHCLTQTKDGETTYYHSVLAAAIVKPGDSVVLPLFPEMIRNEDGAEKQDCERNATKRWLKNRAEEYQWLGLTLLGDDLFSDYNTCKAVLDANMSFIFTCKPQSHKWLTETVEHSYLEEREERNWNGRNHLVYRWNYLNGVEIRDNKETLRVNYLYFEIKNEETGKTTYKNSWITNKLITQENVKLLAQCGRARWKIENEHNNVLKNHGYNLEHNFGHGQNHASDMYCLLAMLAFQMHGIMHLLDEEYQKARRSFGRRDEFFAALRFSFQRFLHQSWEDFMRFVAGPDFDG